jgi:hypothetical protein
MVCIFSSYEHNQRHISEAKRKQVLNTAAAVTNVLMDDINAGVAQVFENEV